MHNRFFGYTHLSITGLKQMGQGGGGGGNPFDIFSQFGFGGRFSVFKRKIS
jgi:hypothetical protein